MQSYEEVKEFVNNHNGMIMTKEFKENQIGFFFINKLMEDKIIERSDIGIYNKMDDFEDRYFILQQKYSNIVFSHNIALYFLGKTEVLPTRIDVTVFSGYNVHRIPKDNIVVHYVKNEYLMLGAIEVISPFGNKVKCYNLERTVCDIVRNENNGLDSEQVNKILRDAFMNKQINVNLLMEYAKKLRCERKLRRLTEVLY